MRYTEQPIIGFTTDTAALVQVKDLCLRSFSDVAL